MPDKKNLSQSDVLHLAKLSNLELSDKEAEKYTEQLSETLDFIHNLDELDTAKTQPTNNVTNLANEGFEDGAANDRGLKQEEVLANASSKKKGLFVVKRLIQ